MEYIKEAEAEFNNRWLVRFDMPNMTDNGNQVRDCDQQGKPTQFYWLDFTLYQWNWNRWEECGSGMIKYSGCADWDLNIHLCGEEDCKVFAWLYEQAKPLIGMGWD